MSSSSDNNNNNNNNNTIITKEFLAFKAFNNIQRSLVPVSEYDLEKIWKECQDWATKMIEKIKNNSEAVSIVNYRLLKFTLSVVKTLTEMKQEKLEKQQEKLEKQQENLEKQQQNLNKLIKLEEERQEQLKAGLALKKMKKGNQLKSTIKY